MRIRVAATKLHGFPQPSSKGGDAQRYGAEVARCLPFVPMKRAEVRLVRQGSGSKVEPSQSAEESHMSASTEFAMSLPFLGYKQRNAMLDNFFYDTKRLSLEERAKLTP